MLYQIVKNLFLLQSFCQRNFSGNNFVDFAKEIEVDLFRNDRVVFVGRMIEDEVTHKFCVRHQVAGRFLTQKVEVFEQRAPGLGVQLHVAQIILKF